MSQIKVKIIKYSSIALFAFFADQISKMFIYNYFQQNEFSSIALLPFLNIVEVYNTGVSFGMFSSVHKNALVFIGLLICVYIVYIISQETDETNRILYTLIVGSAMGNIYDRFVRIGVLDFIDFHIGNWHWAAFNIADSIICVSVFMLIIRDLKKKIN